jgi:hypothetical protein
MFKSIRRNIYQLVAVLFLAVQSLVVCPLLAAAVPISQVNSSPAADKQQQPIITPDRTERSHPERQNRTGQPPQTTADKETAKHTQPYDLDVIKQFDDELYGK